MPKALPVCDDESEKVILARVLADDSDAIKALVQLEPQDFFLAHCKELMSVVQEMQQRQVEINQASIFAFVLERQADLRHLTIQKLTDLISTEARFSTTPNQYYVGKIKQWRHARDIAQAAQNITECFQDPERLQIAVQRFRDLDTSFGENDVSLSGLKSDVDYVVKDIFGKVTRIPPIMSGLQGIDDLLEGFTLGRLTVIGARPGVGKSALATQLMLAALTQSYPSYFFSLEMSRKIVIERMLSQITQMSLAKLKSRTLSEQDMDVVVHIGEKTLFDMHYYIDETRKFPIRNFESRIIRASQQFGQDVKFVVVDYLQLLASNAPGKDRQEQCAFVAEYLTDVAKKLNLHVLALAQLNRESDKREKGKPKSSDLRESGTIEQFADAIILIHREKNSNIGTFLVEKNRHGRTGEVGFSYNGDVLEFR